MDEAYDSHGISFRYPAQWEIQEQEGPDEVVISVASSETAFWTISLLRDQPDLESVVEAAITAFRDEYEELDVYESNASLGGLPTLARDLEFFCLELLNSAWIRAFSTPDFTALVLYQANDDELGTAQPLFDRMSESLIVKIREP